MFMIFTLDSSLDKIDKGDDPCKSLNSLLEKQKQIMDDCIRIRDTCRKPNLRNDGSARDSFIKTEIEKL
jgi:hypothetical protein